MMGKLKKTTRKLTPVWLLQVYHFLIAWASTLYYGFPSKKLVVIGVTGTKGKTTTVNYIARVLEKGGYAVASITSANTRILGKETLNATHMSMPGHGALQAFLYKALGAGCTHVVIEVTSEGLKLMRHKGIIFDIAVFTNLSPEHLPSHGNSFEEYKKAKTKLFRALRKSPKQLKNLPPTAIIANADSEHSTLYYAFPADVHISFGIEKGDIKAQIKESTLNGTTFTVDGATYMTALLGEFLVYNALAAIAVGRILRIPEETIRDGLVMSPIFQGEWK
jgi:UDP-N-acetylmuramoyl-L-alanyl-D-glutamate--2,6-diaminopimelate ligase